MPAGHRPPPLQPTELRDRPKLRSLPTPLRIDAPAHPTTVAIVLEETPSSALSDQSEADSFMPLKPKSLRNRKKLSLTLTSVHSNTSSSSLSFPESPASFAPPPVPPSSFVPSQRRPSIASLSTASASSLRHRRDEETSPSAPYVDGPIQVLPGIWIGSEDNARDWKSLIQRGIKNILNVAKEVASPYSTSVPLRSTASTPNLAQAASQLESDPTYIPAHAASGRPSMHYLRLPWSHGQADLVRDGFVVGMAFVDKSLERGEGVLIHCQCGVSRSATMVIALVMRAAQSNSPPVPQEVLALKNGGMHASYAYVKEKSKWIGPNMSLMYQLLEYERHLNNGNKSPAPSDRSSQLAAEELEWGRRRRELDEESQDGREKVDFMREARALDKQMEERIASRTRRSSQHSTTASVTSNGSVVGVSSGWKSRLGYAIRSRSGSVASNFTNRSVLSEDLLEEDEDNMNVIDIPADSSSSPSTDATEEEAQAPSRLLQDVFTPTTARPPPTAPAGKQEFGFITPSSARHTKTTFGLPSPPSAPAAKQSFSLSTPPSKFKKRKPPPLLPPVPPSPVSVKTPEIAVTEAKPKPKPKPSLVRRALAPLKIPSSLSSRRSSSSTTAPAPTPSQTLFVFPPEQSVTTPSTMTLMSNMSCIPFSLLSTPRVSTFKKEGRKRGHITVGAPPTPTTACSRVDARGFVAIGS